MREVEDQSGVQGGGIFLNWMGRFLNAGDTEVEVKVLAQALSKNPVPVGGIQGVEANEGEQVLDGVRGSGFR